MNSSPPPSIWAPLRNPDFRKLWTAWVIGNLCMVMSEIGAAWLMTTLTHSALVIALVQTAATLPVLLFVLPAGAIIDASERGHWLLYTQLWLFAAAAILAIATGTGLMTPVLLLCLVFANGMGFAMRWPAFISSMPRVLSRVDLPQGLVLHAVSMNMARVLGPGLAGTLLATMGSTFVFVVCAVLSLISALVIGRWTPPPSADHLPRERLWESMRSALLHVAHSAPMRNAMTHIFFACGLVFGLIALLPAYAKRIEGGGSGSYAMWMTCMGLGAIIVGVALPRIQQRLPGARLVAASSLIHVAAALAVGLAHSVTVVALAMGCVGGAWLAVGNGINHSAQVSVPDSLRARGMSLFMTAAMAGSAAGAALFGTVADYTGERNSILILSFTGMLLFLALRRLPLSFRSADGTVSG